MVHVVGLCHNLGIPTYALYYTGNKKHAPAPEGDTLFVFQACEPHTYPGTDSPEQRFPLPLPCRNARDQLRIISRQGGAHSL